jgi:tetratricopeptide (TPR) repeat protein
MRNSIKVAVFVFIFALTAGLSAREVFSQIPTTAREWGDLGVKRLSQKNYQQAVVSFTRSLDLTPDYYFSRINRGTAYYHLKMFQLAINDYDQVLKLKPFHAATFYNRGLAYQAINEHTKAINDLTYATTFDSKDPEGYSARSVSYCKKGEIALARADERKTLQLGGRIAAPCLGSADKVVVSQPNDGWSPMTFNRLAFQTPTKQPDQRCTSRYNKANIHFAQTFFCYKWNNLTLDVGYGKADRAISRTANDAAIRRKAAGVAFDSKYGSDAETTYSTTNHNVAGAKAVLLKIDSDDGLNLIFTKIIYIERGNDLWEVVITYDGDDKTQASAADRIIRSLSIR